MSYKPYNLKDVFDASNQNKFSVISTFAGGGGSSTGYRLAGGKVLCVNEFVEEAQKTYHENYPDTPVLPDDIKEISGKELMDAAGVSVGEIDILDGSPPCSAFSVAGSLSRGGNKTESINLFGETYIREEVRGKHSDGWGATKNYSDGKKVENIEDLFFEFLRVAKDIQPKTIVAENVKGLTMGEAKEYFNKITNTFEEIGYDVSAKVLNSASFGTPQTRQRVIFIGVRQDVTSKVGLSFMNISSVFPEENKEFVTVGDAFEGLENDQEEVNMLIEKMAGSSHWKTVKLMPDDPEKVLTGMDYHPKGHHFNLKRCSRFKPAPTVTATSAPVHFIEKRKLTLAETRRVMSLPDDFILTGRWEQRSERMGRMVPPFMLKAVAEAVYENILKPYKENEGG